MNITAPTWELVSLQTLSSATNPEEVTLRGSFKAPDGSPATVLVTAPFNAHLKFFTDAAKAMALSLERPTGGEVPGAVNLFTPH